MEKYVIQYNRKICIGVGVCEAMNPERWRVLETRKADLKGAILNKHTQLFELEIGQNELQKLQLAARGCPKHAIQIIEKRTGKIII